MPNQALDLYVPVQRFEVLIRRRKGERLVQDKMGALTAGLPLPPGMKLPF